MNISREILVAALAAFKSERQQLDEKIAEVEAMLGGNRKQPTPTVSKGPRKKRSAAVRKRMAQAQKDRWAKLKNESAPKPAPAAPPAKVKRKLSAAGRKAIVAATKKRWADKAAEKATRKSAQ